jgi:uracil-DNA glycosylase
MMRPSDTIFCECFPCLDVNQKGYIIPTIKIDPSRVSLALISEAAPAEHKDYYYAGGDPLFLQTTLQAFRDAGLQVICVQDLLDLGVYLTTAVKCAKTGYAIQSYTIKECSRLLEAELNLFPDLKAYLLMGDVAIKAVNTIAQRAGEARVIPAGSTYKLRHREYFFRGKRAFPSYLQAGPSFYIEKSKRRMIAEDISCALAYINGISGS